jgi:hypothetical protein
LYCQIAETADASATFANLKGLKSSLICTTPVFLITLAPKNGLVGGGFSEGLGIGEENTFGEATAELVDEDGFKPGDDGEATGLKGGAVGLGLKLEALTFNLNAAEVEDVTELVGEAGATEDACESLPESAATPGAETDAARAALLFSGLNGGMAWMNMPENGFAPGLAAAGLAAAATEVVELLFEGTGLRTAGASLS